VVEPSGTTQWRVSVLVSNEVGYQWFFKRNWNGLMHLFRRPGPFGAGIAMVDSAPLAPSSETTAPLPPDIRTARFSFPQPLPLPGSH
jgi:hypothetical protein